MEKAGQAEQAGWWLVVSKSRVWPPMAAAGRSGDDRCVPGHDVRKQGGAGQVREWQFVSSPSSVRAGIALAPSAREDEKMQREGKEGDHVTYDQTILACRSAVRCWSPCAADCGAAVLRSLPAKQDFGTRCSNCMFSCMHRIVHKLGERQAGSFLFSKKRKRVDEDDSPGVLKTP